MNPKNDNVGKKWLREASMRRLSLLVKNKTELIGNASQLGVGVLQPELIEKSGLSKTEVFHLKQWVAGVETGRQCMLAILDSRHVEQEDFRDSTSSRRDNTIPASGNTVGQSQPQQAFQPVELIRSAIHLPEDFLCDSGYLYETIFRRPPTSVVREALQTLVRKAYEKSPAALGVDQINLAIKQLRLDNLGDAMESPGEKEEEEEEDDKDDAHMPSSTSAPAPSASASASAPRGTAEEEALRLQIFIELVRTHITATNKRSSSTAAGASSSSSSSSSSSTTSSVADIVPTSSPTTVTEPDSEGESEDDGEGYYGEYDDEDNDDDDDDVEDEEDINGEDGMEEDAKAGRDENGHPIKRSNAKHKSDSHSRKQSKKQKARRLDIATIEEHLRTPLKQIFHQAERMPVDRLESMNNLLKPYLKQLSSLKASLGAELKDLQDSRAFLALGVSSEASDADIKKAYRSLAVRLHPDKPGGSTERFQQLQDAYQEVMKKRRADCAEKQAMDEVRARTNSSRGAEGEGETPTTSKEQTPDAPKEDEEDEENDGDESGNAFGWHRKKRDSQKKNDDQQDAAHEEADDEEEEAEAEIQSKDFELDDDDDDDEDIEVDVDQDGNVIIKPARKSHNKAKDRKDSSRGGEEEDEGSAKSGAMEEDDDDVHQAGKSSTNSDEDDDDDEDDENDDIEDLLNKLDGTEDMDEVFRMISQNAKEKARRQAEKRHKKRLASESNNGGAGGDGDKDDPFSHYPNSDSSSRKPSNSGAGAGAGMRGEFDPFAGGFGESGPAGFRFGAGLPSFAPQSASNLTHEEALAHANQILTKISALMSQIKAAGAQCTQLAQLNIKWQKMVDKAMLPTPTTSAAAGASAVTDAKLKDVYKYMTASSGNKSVLRGKATPTSNKNNTTETTAVSNVDACALQQAVVPVETVCELVQQVASLAMEVPNTCGVRFAAAAAGDKQFMLSVDRSMQLSLGALKTVLGLIATQEQLTGCLKRVKESMKLANDNPEIESLLFEMLRTGVKSNVVTISNAVDRVIESAMSASDVKNAVQQLIKTVVKQEKLEAKRKAAEAEYRQQEDDYCEEDKEALRKCREDRRSEDAGRRQQQSGPGGEGKDGQAGGPDADGESERTSNHPPGSLEDLRDRIRLLQVQLKVQHVQALQTMNSEVITLQQQIIKEVQGLPFVSSVEALFTQDHTTASAKQGGGAYSKSNNSSAASDSRTSLLTLLAELIDSSCHALQNDLLHPSTTAAAASTSRVSQELLLGKHFHWLRIELADGSNSRELLDSVIQALPKEAAAPTVAPAVTTTTGNTTTTNSLAAEDKQEAVDGEVDGANSSSTTGTNTNTSTTGTSTSTSGSSNGSNDNDKDEAVKSEPTSTSQPAPVNMRLALLPDYRSKTLYLASMVDIASVREMLGAQLLQRLEEILLEGRGKLDLKQTSRATPSTNPGSLGSATSTSTTGDGVGSVAQEADRTTTTAGAVAVEKEEEEEGAGSSVAAAVSSVPAIPRPSSQCLNDIDEDEEDFADVAAAVPEVPTEPTGVDYANSPSSMTTIPLPSTSSTHSSTATAAAAEETAPSQKGSNSNSSTMEDGEDGDDAQLYHDVDVDIGLDLGEIDVDMRENNPSNGTQSGKIASSAPMGVENDATENLKPNLMSL